MKYFVRRSKIKGWKKRIAVLACMAAIVAAAAGYCSYRQLMDGVLIVQYFDSVAGNLDWQAVRMRVIVPEDRYREGWTEDALRMYAIIRSRNVPDRIDIAIYGSMEGSGSARNTRKHPMKNKIRMAGRRRKT